MDKNMLMIIICILIFYIVYLKIDENIQKSRNTFNNNKEIEEEQEPVEKFQNNIVSNKNKEFDPYTFYKHNSKESNISKNKLEFDFDYETDFKYKDYDKSDDNKYFKETFDQDHMMHDELEHENLVHENLVDKNVVSDNLVPDNLDSNFIYSMPFPENTSIELAQFTAENVTDLYDVNSMEELYNNLNADPYQGYKSLKYML